MKITRISSRTVVASGFAAVGIFSGALTFAGHDASAAQVTVHSADVSLSCGNYDLRTATDRLPQPGVVVITTYKYFPDDYTAYTIDPETGSKSYILDGRPSSEIPIVSVWQNGTSCFGSSYSRNAWVVTPQGMIYGESDLSGPPASNYGGTAGVHLNQPIVGMSPTSSGLGYWLVASDGGIFAFGDAAFHGSLGSVHLDRPVAGMSVTPTGHGYWLVASDGGIFAFGDARFYGSLGGLRLDRPIVGMTATPSGHGYWLVASDGGIFAFGDAAFHGSTGGRTLSAPIAGMIPNGTGYTLIGQDGQTYPFG